MTTEGNMVRAAFLADAFEAVARVNHYMVGIIEDYLDDELDRAEQILINKQNAGPQKGARYAVFERALDLVGAARKTRRATPDGDRKAYVFLTAIEAAPSAQE